MKPVINKKNRNSISKNFKERIKKIIPLFKSFSSILVISQITILGFFLVDQSGRTKINFEKIINKIDNRYDDLYINDYKDYFFDTFRSFFSRKKLRRIDLAINFKQRSKLDCDRQRIENCSNDKWAKAQMISGKEVYKIKLRAKGDREIHRLNFKTMSFKVDIRGEKRLNGMEEFSLQIPTIRNYTYELLASDIVKEEGLISPRHEYIRLFVNGEYFGIRHIEEGFGKELIEASEKRYGPIFSLDENYTTLFQESKFDLADAKNWQTRTNKELSMQALSTLEAIKSNRNIAQKYFDIDKWSKYFAIMDALKLIHATYPKSVKFFLNPSKGLIEPIFYDGHFGAGTGKYADSRLIDVALYENCPWNCEHEEVFYKVFFGDYQNINIDFYEKYLTHLQRITKSDYIKKIIEPKWNSYWFERAKLYREFWRADRIFSIGLLPHIGQWTSLEKRLNKISNEINIAKTNYPKISSNIKGDKIYLTNDLARFPQIVKFECKDIKSKGVILEKGITKLVDLDNLGRCDIFNTKISIDNFKSNELISQKLISSYEMDKKLESETLKKIPISENIIFKSGLNKIKKNSFLKSKNIIFEEGSNLCLQDNQHLIINSSNIDFNGTSEKPNLIFLCEDNQNGSLTIEGSNVFINNLIVKDLNSPKIELRKLYGGINFIDSSINFEKIKVLNSKGEDGVNFINSNVKGNLFNAENIKSDALDSDFSVIDIKKIQCNNIGNDCYDLSYSKSYIQEIEADNVKDKVLSVGEASNLKINGVIVSNSEIGVVSKDSSSLNIGSFKFSKVKLPLAAYIKKTELGSPNIRINSSIPEINNENSFISKDSNVYLSKSRILGEMTSKEVFEKLYGNLFGSKTIR